MPIPSEETEPSFSVSATLAIAMVLCAPFVARSLSPALEPYPAVLLPSGSGWIESRTKQLRFDQLKLWGRCSGELWRELDPERFMHPIPVQYLGAIEQRDFGLLAPASQHVTVKLFGNIEVSGPPASPGALAQTRHWLGRRLETLGCSPKALRVTRQVKLVEVPSGRVTSGPLSEPEVIHVLD